MIHADPALRTPMQEEADAAFQRAGHPPQHPNCDHREYRRALHGLVCPCGTFMEDAGD